MADYYAVLELTPEASEAEIRAAYRRLVRHHHPDLHPHRADAEARMRALNEAYAVLSDPAARARYHAARPMRVRVHPAPSPPPRPAPPPRPTPRPAPAPPAYRARPTTRTHVDLSGVRPGTPYARTPRETLDDLETLMLVRTLQLLRRLLG
jgi:hypothetical protein